MESVAAEAIDGDRFRLAMRDLAGAVSLVTTRLGARRTGCVVSSLISYEISPPTLLLTLSRTNSTAALLAESRRFAVSLLSAKLSGLAEGFGRAAAGEARFVDGAWREMAPGGQWIADGALAAFECALDEAIARRSHLIVLGRVERLIHDQNVDSRALVHWRRSYHDIGSRRP